MLEELHGKSVSQCTEGRGSDSRLLATAVAQKKRFSNPCRRDLSEANNIRHSPVFCAGGTAEISRG